MAVMAGGYLPEMAIELWKGYPQPELRISQEVGFWLECRRRESEGSGAAPHLRTKRAVRRVARAGNAFAAFPVPTRRNAASGCAQSVLCWRTRWAWARRCRRSRPARLLRRLKRIERVLIVTPTSLQGEWEEQIARFTRLPCQTLGGSRPDRLASYERDRGAIFHARHL